MSDLQHASTADLLAEISRRKDRRAIDEAHVLACIGVSAASLDRMMILEAVEIINQAAVLWQVPSRAIYGRTRTALVAEARMACMAVLTRRGYSYNSIGRAFGRDHGTVMHARATITKKAETDAGLSAKVKALISKALQATSVSQE